MALGYRLTVGETLEYYTMERSAAARFLARAAEGRSVQLRDFGGLNDAPAQAVQAASPDAFQEVARRFLAAALPGCRPGVTPRRYPAFHGAMRRDVVLEVDAKQSQQDCFDRSRRILEFLEQYGAPYRLKYSGNCSAHFIIPQEAYEPLIPAERWEEDAHRFRRWVIAHCGVKVDEELSTDDHLLRLPYSLHERTGLVSLPIDPARYDEFRPEMAEVRNVRVEDAWFRTDDFEAKRDGMRRMLQEALGDGD